MLLGVAIVSGVGRAASRSSAATTGLVAAYAFDEASGTTVSDASGSGNTGTTANTTWVAGKNGGALSFNGTSSRVTIPDATGLRLTTAMTLEAWVDKTGTNSGWRDVIYKGNDNYYLSANSTPNNVPAGGAIIGGSYGEAYGTATLATNTWAHLALTYDGTTVRLYVNGTQVSSTPKTGSIATSTNALTIGSDTLYGQYFQGLIDDVRVYNIALTAAQVQTDMNTPVGPSVGDTQAPTAPASLSATAVNSGRVDLSWGASTDNVGVTGYRVERCAGSGCSSFTQIAAPTGTGTTYSDTSTSASTSYTYRVRATDAAGNLSGYSPNATAITPASTDTQAPTAPGSLTATAVDGARVDLSWGASTDNVGVTGYRVERCAGSGCSNFAQIAAPTGTGTTFSDTTAVAGTTYVYRVRATDAAGNLSGYSPTATATTPSPDTQVPTAPASLSATAVSSGRVDLSWGASTDNVGVTGYRVERCAGSGCSSFTQIAAPTGTGTTYSDTSASASTSYTYRVRATDAAGNLSGYSPTATATTPAATGPTPVAEYSFDEGTGVALLDSSGNGNDGTISNATWTMGKNGSALSFDGASSRVTIPDAASLDLTTGMTLEAWVDSIGTNTSWRDVVYKGDDNYYLSGSSDQSNHPAGGGIIGAVHAQTYGTASLAANTWTHLAVTYDGTTIRLYVNGTQVSSVAKTGTIATSTNPLTIGSDSFYGQYFQGLIDDVRVYNIALSATQVQTDMTTPVPRAANGDTQPPSISISSPSAGSTVKDLITATTSASDNVGVLGVQFYVDGVASGAEDLAAPFNFMWDTNVISNGTHTLTARARDRAGNTTMSAPVTVTVANPGVFQVETLATSFTLPTSFAFLPDGRLLVAEMGGAVKIVAPPYTQPNTQPLLQITNLAPITTTGDINGIMNIAVDPNFTQNHYFYVDYTMGNPYRTTLSRFTANSTITGTVPGSELILYQDGQQAGADHHAGAIMFGNDGKLYFTTGDEVSTPAASQDLTSTRGKVHRINMDGTIPLDNPFADGSGPNDDSVWAYGLRNPYRGFYDSQTGQMYVGDVGGNVYSTATEHLDLVQRGANYAWPNCESNCASPPYTNGIYNYPHNGRDAAITAGFVYHGPQFPPSYNGSFFFADYAQNWIKRLTLDPSSTTVTGVFPFEPPDGSPDGPWGSITDLTEGPDGSLFYLDIGFDDNTDTVKTPRIIRIRYVQSNLPPTSSAAADVTQGPAPLTVNFSSAGSSDPEGQPLSYSWDFGDGTTSTAANPAHTYTTAGRYTVRLTVSDGTNSTISNPLTITAGSPPVPTILTPADGLTFRGGDDISYSGTATDAEDGTLPQSAYTWEIDMLHAGHVHPGLPTSGSSTGTFTIPVTGHDFSGNVRYQISLTVTDSNGISTTTSVIIWPQKVNLTFDTAPEGLTIDVNGLPATTPFVHDELIGFHDDVQAPNQTVGSTNYAFNSWSDGGAQEHTVVVPSADASYTANFTTTSPPPVPTFVQVASSTPQTKQTSVATSFASAERAGDLNVVVIGFDNKTSTISSVVDTAGNVYQVAAPLTRSAGNSQAIYYAKNVLPGPDTVTVTLNTATPFVDVRSLEYSGLSLTNPFDVTASGSGKSTAPSSGSATTTTASELLVGGGTTMGSFLSAGTGYTSRIITAPNADIVEDRLVSATGGYSATGTTTSANWVMQLATFRAGP